jgi:5-formyltetrahydrofolate cyclo-ligase
VDKKTLRQYIRQNKRQMTEEQIVDASERLGELFRSCEEYKQAKAIYGYLPYFLHLNRPGLSS